MHKSSRCSQAEVVWVDTGSDTYLNRDQWPCLTMFLYNILSLVIQGIQLGVLAPIKYENLQIQEAVSNMQQFLSSRICHVLAFCKGISHLEIVKMIPHEEDCISKLAAGQSCIRSLRLGDSPLVHQ